jgi:hypothetical protein
MRRKIISLCHLRPLCVLEAPLFQDVQRQVAHIIEDKIIIGHSIWTFLSVGSKTVCRRAITGLQ